ncbi:MAG: hypothetical protein QOE30_3034 [Mycobacterium sp.]|jgi:hypothetical protein|uniref:DUF2567 domain-containing protein n=1 Tax=Mycobacterium sp. TaxID=1785 RepID=UPI0028B3FEE7|nr:DUF2567 domain-containing protein [Mycobacterium sp.]MDT5117295.1 hypothetical protein [Mycobacterium sp.]
MTEPAGPATPQSARVAAPSRVRAIVLAALGLSASGVLVGGLWAWMAPPIHLVVAMTRAGERVHDYLGDESQHFFDVPCLMLGLLTVLAVVAPVLAWQWRRLRGPGMVIGLTIGMVVAAAVASTVGAVLVLLRYGALDIDQVPLLGRPSVAYVIQAPPVFLGLAPLQIATTLLWPAAVAALVYSLLAAGSARDDLGSSGPTAALSHTLPREPEASVS